jgi:maltose O-acetyltransferase
MEHVDLRAQPAASRVGNPLITVGDGTHLARFATVWATVGITIGAGVLSSDYVALLDCWGDIGGIHDGVTAPQSAPIVIADGAYLGCRCIIGPGVTVGEGAFVGEGAVVLEDVPAHSVVYGNPAQVTRHWSAASGWQGDMFARAN